ncbi:23945_t:CDS:1, partial [Racocetra persica]
VGKADVNNIDADKADADEADANEAIAAKANMNIIEDKATVNNIDVNNEADVDE